MKLPLVLLCACCAASASYADDLVGLRFERGAASPKALLEQFGAAASKMPAAKFSLADSLPAVRAQAGDEPAASSDYLDAVRAAEADVLAWDQALRDAPAGSDEEAAARRNLSAAQDRGQALADDEASLEAYPSSDIEALTKDYAAKYQAAAAGGAPESFYKAFLSNGWKAFAGSSQREISWLGHWRRVVDAAKRFDARYQAAASGSDEETAARATRDYAWGRAPEILEKQLAAVTGSYRGIEKMGAEFDAGYQAAASGSAAETFYKRAREIAYDAAWREASAAVAAEPDLNAVGAIAAEYDAKAAAAAAGSPAEAYFGKVRDLARRRLTP